LSLRMAQPSNNQNFLSELKRELSQIWRSTCTRIRRGQVAFRNRVRAFRRLELDYIAMTIGGPLPERTGPPRSFLQRRLPLPAQPLSIELLNRRLSRIMDANNVKGVILVFQGLPGGIAKLSTLRNAIERVQAAGKECIVFTPYLDTRHYFVASAADTIITPASSTFEVLGLNAETIFLNDALTKMGIDVEVFQVSPYKGAYDMLGKADISPEQKEQLNWLLDENFNIIVEGISTGRKLSVEQVRSLIDSAPFSAGQALKAGLIDYIAYEDEMSHLLGRQKTAVNDDESSSEAVGKKNGKDVTTTRARIVTWPEAQGMLQEKWRRPTKSYIGVLSLEGQIMMGESRRAPVRLPIPIPLFGSNSVGETSVLSMLRQVERDKQMAALVVHIDSGGGSPLASDLISRQLKRIAQKIPVVVYMGDVSASGGYYIAAVATKIVSQPASLTGSIGVVSLHLNLEGLYDKVRVNRVSLGRGKRSSLYSENRQLSADDREVINQQMDDLYMRFKQLVSINRDIPDDVLEPMCGGRVWSGRQAKDKGLVDVLGDMETAVELAIDLAGLPRDEDRFVPTRNLYQSTSRYMLPEPFETPGELAALVNLEQILSLGSRPLYILPYHIKFS